MEAIFEMTTVSTDAAIRKKNLLIFIGTAEKRTFLFFITTDEIVIFGVLHVMYA